MGGLIKHFMRSSGLIVSILAISSANSLKSTTVQPMTQAYTALLLSFTKGGTQINQEATTNVLFRTSVHAFGSTRFVVLVQVLFLIHCVKHILTSPQSRIDGLSNRSYYCAFESLVSSNSSSLRNST